MNKSGNVIAPSLEATSLSAAVKIPLDGRISLTDTDAAAGYPITGFSWALVYENLHRNAAIKSRDDAEQLVKFLHWVVTEGQNMNEKLSFARLPKDAQAVAIQMLKTLKYENEMIGEKVIASAR